MAHALLPGFLARNQSGAARLWEHRRV